ncbi:MAG: Ig-like domain-containing protein [Lachnospiraceae bacterium]|nr:Ig-like domain-containing protein [Lachnospiraceae bacterium]
MRSRTALILAAVMLFVTMGMPLTQTVWADEGEDVAIEEPETEIPGIADPEPAPMEPELPDLPQNGGEEGLEPSGSIPVVIPAPSAKPANPSGNNSGGGNTTPGTPGQPGVKPGTNPSLPGTTPAPAPGTDPGNGVSPKPEAPKPERPPILEKLITKLPPVQKMMEFIGFDFEEDKDEDLEDTGAVSVNSITLDRDSASAVKDSTIVLKATIEPTNADNMALEWTTGNASVVAITDTVSSGNTSTCTLKAVGAGETLVTARSTDGTNKSASCMVKIVEEAGEVTVLVNGALDPDYWAVMLDPVDASKNYTLRITRSTLSKDFKVALSLINKKYQPTSQVVYDIDLYDSMDNRITALPGNQRVQITVPKPSGMNYKKGAIVVASYHEDNAVHSWTPIFNANYVQFEANLFSDFAVLYYADPAKSSTTSTTTTSSSSSSKSTSSYSYTTSTSYSTSSTTAPASKAASEGRPLDAVPKTGEFEEYEVDMNSSRSGWSGLFRLFR